VRLDSAFGPEAATRIGLPDPQGARVTGITTGSPAESAKFQVGDVILAFDGTRIEDDNHLINMVNLTPVNKEVEVRLVRAGKSLSIKVRVGNRTDMPTE
jgi:serine protease Do